MHSVDRPPCRADAMAACDDSGVVLSGGCRISLDYGVLCAYTGEAGMLK